jgi:hypothetical protein
MYACLHVCLQEEIMDIKLTKTYRISIENVEGLMDRRALTGKSINEMINEAIADYLNKSITPYQVERVEDIKPYVYDGPVIPAKLEEDSGTPPPNFNNTTTADPPNFDNTTTGEAPKNNLRLFGDEEDGIKF